MNLEFDQLDHLLHFGCIGIIVSELIFCIIISVNILVLVIYFIRVLDLANSRTDTTFNLIISFRYLLIGYFLYHLYFDICHFHFQIIDLDRNNFLHFSLLQHLIDLDVLQYQSLFLFIFFVISTFSKLRSYQMLLFCY